MDMVTSIAATSIGMSSARALSDVNVALMGKALDFAAEQGQALEQMMESVPTSNLLDVYA